MSGLEQKSHNYKIVRNPRERGSLQIKGEKTKGEKNEGEKTKGRQTRGWEYILVSLQKLSWSAFRWFFSLIIESQFLTEFKN